MEIEDLYEAKTRAFLEIKELREAQNQRKLPKTKQKRLEWLAGEFAWIDKQIDKAIGSHND